MLAVDVVMPECASCSGDNVTVVKGVISAAFDVTVAWLATSGFFQKLSKKPTHATPPRIA